MDEDTINLGACCACGKPGPTVRNIMMLHKPAPVKGKGWGCMVCHLGSDGAVAVVCDACFDAERPIVVVCLGYPASGQRVSIETLEGTFEHNLALHGAVQVVWPPDDDDSLCYCSGDESGHDPDPGGVFHINERVLSRARRERREE